MSTLTERQIGELIRPYLWFDGKLVESPESLVGQLRSYLDLLTKWNSRTNLSAVRVPHEMVERHFGESLFAAICLRKFIGANATVLDLGSGAGFPGLPIQLMYPDLRVTLAESQGKKAAFLREVIRSLGLSSVVWGGRAEEMECDSFEAVTMRAVDRMGAMTVVARSKLRPSGILLQLTGESTGSGTEYPVPRRKGSFVRVTPAE